MKSLKNCMKTMLAIIEQSAPKLVKQEEPKTKALDINRTVSSWDKMTIAERIVSMGPSSPEHDAAKKAASMRARLFNIEVKIRKDEE